jgi:5,10-methylenetetrahydromethanopterin reductase
VTHRRVIFHLYIGATGPKMLEMAGEICDGVVLNYVVSVEYIRNAVELVRKGAEKAGKTPRRGRPARTAGLLPVRRRSASRDAGRQGAGGLLPGHRTAHYESQQRRRRISSSKYRSLSAGPQPRPTTAAPQRLIPDDVVRNLMAVGTSRQCREKVAEYIDAGVTCPILYPMMDDIKPVIDAFADWEP